MPSEEKKNKRKKIIVSVMIAIVLIIASLILLLRGCNNTQVITTEVPAIGDAIEGHLPSMSKEEIMAQMQRAADASYFSFKINAEPVFEKSNSKGNLEIENPSYNVYPMAVRIYLDDTSQLLYDSGLILPNHYIQSAELDVQLPSGVYKCTADILAYDIDAQKYLSKSQAGITITIY